MKENNKPVNTVVDIWKAYSAKLLKDNPTWWGSTDHGYNRVGVYRVYRSIEMREGKSVEEVISYPRFRKIIEHYINVAKREIIAGNAVKIPHVGKICAVHVQRDFRGDRHKIINWKATMLRPKVLNPVKNKMVPDRMIYYTTDTWARIAWFKPKMTNVLVYEFKPTAPSSVGIGGFIREFSEALTKNTYLKLNYLYCPLKKKTCSTNPQAPVKS